LLIQPFLGGFARVDGAALVGRISPRHRGVPAAGRSQRTPVRVAGKRIGSASAQKTAGPTTRSRGSSAQSPTASGNAWLATRNRDGGPAPQGGGPAILAATGSRASAAGGAASWRARFAVAPRRSGGVGAVAPVAARLRPVPGCGRRSPASAAHG